MANANHTAAPTFDYSRESLLEVFACKDGRKLLKPQKDYLPYIAVGRDLPAADNWDVPATGGFIGGEATGRALARMHLKRQRDGLAKGRRPDIYLTDIHTSFMIRFEEEGGKAMLNMGSFQGSEAFSSLLGQCIGFFSDLSEWIDAAVQGDIGAKLDQMSNDDLLAQANKGLCFDHRAYRTAVADNNSMPTF